MTDSSEQRLCNLNEIADGGALEVIAQVEGEATSVLLLKLGNDARAFHNVCPHAGRALNWAPGRFLIEGGLLICAAHGASFRIPDGECVGGPCRGSRLQTVPIRRVDDTIFLSTSG